MYNPDHSASLQQSPLGDQPPCLGGRLGQRGFSLIELMVGLTIGLLVVLAAIGSLVFTQASSAVVGDGARLQQQADAVFRNIGYHVSQAGANELIAAPALASSAPELAKVVFSSAYQGFNTGTSHTGIYNIHGVEGASNAPDTLRVSYEDSGSSRDCLGQHPPVNTPPTVNMDNSFYVSGTELMCLGVGSTTPQSIASGVEDFQVKYGVRTGNIPGAEQYRFYTANQMGDPPTVPNWASIQAVQICIQMAGDGKGNPQPGLVLKGCRDQTLTNDGLLRRVFWRTFSLRNAML